MKPGGKTPMDYFVIEYSENGVAKQLALAAKDKHDARERASRFVGLFGPARESLTVGKAREFVFCEGKFHRLDAEAKEPPEHSLANEAAKHALGKLAEQPKPIPGSL
jgi:hypothetical protein